MVYVRVRMRVRVREHAPAHLRSHFSSQSSSPLTTSGFQGLNSGPQACTEILLPAELCLQSLLRYYNGLYIMLSSHRKDLNEKYGRHRQRGDSTVTAHLSHCAPVSEGRWCWMLTL